MSRKSDLTGMRFGKLIAVVPTMERKNGYTVWICKCDCGNTAHVSSRFLKNGWATSCGCESKKPRYDDLTGKRFGKLKVISVVEERDEKGRVQWNCVCDCGKKIIVSAGQLVRGYRRSCGCLSHPQRKDWVGKQFGDLTVIAYDGKRDKKHYWKCKCSCGNETIVCQSSLKSGHTISCGCRNTLFAAKHYIDGTCLESIRSRRVAKNNSSGVRGVYKSQRSGKWCAQITFQGKTRYLGSFATLEDAAQARKKGEQIFDEFLARYDLEHTDRKEQTGRIPQEEVRARTRQIVQALHADTGADAAKIPV